MHPIITENIDKIHTTSLGVIRIKKNLKLQIEDVLPYIKNVLLDEACMISREGKNWYGRYGDIQITINASSYTIITAHKMK